MELINNAMASLPGQSSRKAETKYEPVQPIKANKAKEQNFTGPPNAPSTVTEESLNMSEPSCKRNKQDRSKPEFFQARANNETTIPVKNDTRRFMFSVVQPARIPSISESPSYQYFVGQHLKNLYDVYFQESLFDSSSIIDQFIQKYGLDRILHIRELDAIRWKNSGTDNYKVYRDSAYETLKAIPVDVFDHQVAENAIQACAQAEIDKSLSQSANPVESKDLFDSINNLCDEYFDFAFVASIPEIEFFM